MSVNTLLNLTPGVIIDAKTRNAFLSLTPKEILVDKGKHFTFILVRPDQIW